jgi:8-oxo-dGTP diphosphatase
MPTTGVVCYIRDRGRVLLQLKAQGRFGGGFWNAPGGKLEDGESPAEAVVREVREETGLAVEGLEDRGLLVFHFGVPEEPELLVHVFTAARFQGDVVASDEGRLEWIAEKRLPFDQMWADDRYWLHHVLAGKRVAGVFRFTPDWQDLLEHEVVVE